MKVDNLFLEAEDAMGQPKVLDGRPEWTKPEVTVRLAGQAVTIVSPDAARRAAQALLDGASLLEEEILRHLSDTFARNEKGAA